MMKGDLRKQAILEAAETLFFEKGYMAATVQDFLDMLGCSKGSFYHHFDSKLQVLSALCREKARRAYAQYSQVLYDTDMDRLNGLIYYAMPFRAGEEKTVALLLPLEGMADGNVVRQAIWEAQKELFFPELCRVLELLRAAGTVYYSQAVLPELLWDTYTIVYGHLMAQAAAVYNGGGTGGVVKLIEGERFLWQRLLDAPFGAIEVVRGDEALQVIDHAISRIRRQTAREQEDS